MAHHRSVPWPVLTLQLPPRAPDQFTKTSLLLADLAGGHADRTWQTRLRK